MDRKYKMAREALKIPLHEVLDRINNDLAELGLTMTVGCLFRIEEDIRRKHDVKSAVAQKYYARLYDYWDRLKKFGDIDRKYGGDDDDLQ